MVDKVSPVWHPFTQHALAEPTLNIVSAEGAYLNTDDGRNILDAISSWWVNTHGHGHPHIVQAIKNQAAQLEQGKTISAETQKELRYATRRLTQKLEE